MRIVYSLSLEELNHVQFSCRLISDRQDSESLDNCGRNDMYWIECHLGKTDLGSLCVSPKGITGELFDISRNHCQVEQMQSLVTRARNWFTDQPEYQQQIIWYRQLLAKFS